GPPCARLPSILRIEIRADAGAGTPMPDSARSSPHGWEGATFVASATGVAPDGWPSIPRPAHHSGASPVTFRRRGGAPCCISVSLQSLDKKSLRENTAGWYRFCLLLEYR